MHRFIPLYLCAAFLFDTGIAKAEGGYENGCDGTVLFECNKIAAKCREPSFSPPPFPNDPYRADALVRTAIDGALTGCEGRNYDLCFTLSDLLLRFVTQPDDPRYSDLGRITAYLAATEAGCDAQITAACYWRSVAFNPLMPEGYEIGLALQMADGLTRPQAEAALANTRALFKSRTTDVATLEVAQLRRTCTLTNTPDCTALAVLLTEYEALRTTPFEHLPLILRACTTTDRTTFIKVSVTLFSLGMAPVNPDTLALNSRTIDNLKSTCAAGNAAHCLILAKEARNDPTLDRTKLRQLACDLGAGDACLSLAQSQLYTFGDTKDPVDLLPATNWLEQGCTLKSNLACHVLEHLSKG